VWKPVLVVSQTRQNTELVEHKNKMVWKLDTTNGVPSRTSCCQDCIPQLEEGLLSCQHAAIKIITKTYEREITLKAPSDSIT
jgi:hypothetical protein